MYPLNQISSTGRLAKCSKDILWPFFYFHNAELIGLFGD